ncbi:Allantoinase [Salinivirga cyanobacteriivorans]|uniref:Allantoinase n=1 Tax=Salinivirga cyanobacteriivorans TaxID=1307839 RepID=A0A0S2I098_9BACT|nr:dihydroorotase [Salinivirga cyanobacteriivorans]ALO15712.1 Allantoinase [Salinivirga cyanobacteriivorans]
MNKILISNATIINEGRKFRGSVLIEDNFIKTIFEEPFPQAEGQVYDAKGKWLIPGVIDDQVHFREPGLTHKATIASESKAAVAGGVTSFMEMPNTIPQTTTLEALEEKIENANAVSPANFSFYFGATNDNAELLKKIDPAKTCGVKVFMGSSTGNMLVDDDKVLETIFKESPVIITTHCEDEYTIKENTKKAKEKHGDQIPFSKHPEIRSAEACYLSSSKAVELANKTGARLHILHLSTAKEMSLFAAGHVCDKKITAEGCVHHLWFDDSSYEEKGSLIKWNPAIKSSDDREALREAVRSGRIDVVATDHAPHTYEEKMNPYIKAPSGGPLVQHSLVAMMEMAHEGIFTPELVVEKMCHNPARLFQVNRRGFIREGFYADLVLIDPDRKWQVSKENILYKCGWSPFEGQEFHSAVTHTWVNGSLVYNEGEVHDTPAGMALEFNRDRNNENSIC